MAASTDSAKWRNVKFVNALKNAIHETFEYHVLEPVKFGKMVRQSNILTDGDLSVITAKQKSEGQVSAASELLERIARYRGWYDCMMQVLCHEDILLEHVAEEIKNIEEQLTEDWTKSRTRSETSAKTIFGPERSFQESQSQDTESLDDLRYRLKEMEIAKKKVEHECQDMRLKELDAEKKYKDLVLEKIQNEEKNRKLDQENKKVKDENTVLRKDCQKLKDEKLQLDEECQRLKNENERLSTGKNQTEQELRGLKDKNLQIHKEYQKLNDEKLQLEKECQRIKDENKKLSSGKTQTEQECQRLKDEKMKIEKDFGKIVDEKLHLEEKCRNLEKGQEGAMASVRKGMLQFSDLTSGDLEKRKMILEEQGTFDNEVILENVDIDPVTLHELCPNKELHIQFQSQDTDIELPQGYNDDGQLKECILGLAQLSVLIKVKKISSKRPATFPYSERPYPFSKHSGEGLVRLGSGWVWGVNEYEGPCQCDTCKVTTTAPRYGEVIIRTATHLVFDGEESKHTEVELHCGDQRVTLTGGRWDNYSNSVIEDWCFVYFTTHDMDLLGRLEQMAEHMYTAQWELNKKYERSHPGGLAIMVSHPHGVARAKISVGETKQWEQKEIGGRNYYRLSSTISTCVGCSGARVWPVGYKTPHGWFVDSLPHSERNPDGGQITAWRE